MAVLSSRDREALAIGRHYLDHKDGAIHQWERESLAAVTELDVGVPSLASGKSARKIDRPSDSAAPAPPPLLDRILGELANVYERVNAESRRVKEIADVAVGTLPEVDKDKTGRESSDGRVHEALERLQDVHQAITALRNQVDRLVPL